VLTRRGDSPGRAETGWYPPNCFLPPTSASKPASGPGIRCPGRWRPYHLGPSRRSAPRHWGGGEGETPFAAMCPQMGSVDTEERQASCEDGLQLTPTLSRPSSRDQVENRLRARRLIGRAEAVGRRRQAWGWFNADVSAAHFFTMLSSNVCMYGG
jgi:hypothetical protein